MPHDEIDEVVAALDYPLERMEGESLARALIRFQSGKIAAFDAMMLDTVLSSRYTVSRWGTGDFSVC